MEKTPDTSADSTDVLQQCIVTDKELRSLLALVAIDSTLESPWLFKISSAIACVEQLNHYSQTQEIAKMQTSINSMLSELGVKLDV